MHVSPVIAVIPSYSGDRRIRLSPAYLDALCDSGGIGAVLSYTDNENKICRYADMFDGFLFSGGVDLDPAYYGEEKCFDRVEIDAERDRFELSLLRVIIGTGKPILGICRGIQLLNVALGGSLVQHMEGHTQRESGNVCTQRVRVDEASRLFGIVGATEIVTNTFHHQAVKQIANTLRAVAWAEDGTLEAVESTVHPFLIGVQWHPELYYQNDRSARALFDAFIKAASHQSS